MFKWPKIIDYDNIIDKKQELEKDLDKYKINWIDKPQINWKTYLTDYNEITSNIILDSSPDKDHTAEWSKTTVTVDGNSTWFWALLYLESDWNYDEADSSDDTKHNMPVIALESWTWSKQVLLQWYIRDDTWTWTVWATLFMSLTTWAFTETAPSATWEIVQIMWFAVTADVIYFKPSYDFIEIT